MNENGDWTVIRISVLTVALCGLGMLGIPQVQAEQLNRAEADALKHLIQPKFAVAETIESAEFAAEHCPGLHVSEDGVLAEAADVGVTLDDADVFNSPEWKVWEERGRMNSAIGYNEDPGAFCERMWRWLGPEHNPPTFKRTLLTKD